MKKLLALLFFAAVAAAIPIVIVQGKAKTISDAVAALEKFDIPTDPYADPVERNYRDPKGNTVKRTDIEPWDKDHGKTSVVRDVWALRQKGTIEPTVAVARDATKSPAARIGAALALGLSNENIKKSEREQIHQALASMLSEDGNRLAEFAAFAFGKNKHKAAYDVLAPIATDQKQKPTTRYYALVAIRDTRFNIGPNEILPDVPSKAIGVGLSDPDVKVRGLAADLARWVKGIEIGDKKLDDELFRLIGDADVAVSDAARDSLRFKVAELDTPATKHAPRCEAAYQSPHVHSRANALHILTALNADVTKERMGAAIPPKLELYRVAWEKDAGVPLVFGAAAEGLGRFGPAEDKVTVAALLNGDGVADLVIDGVVRGLKETAKLPALVGALTQAVGKGGKVGAAAAGLLALHGGKDAVPALVAQLRAAADDEAKKPYLVALQTLANNPKWKAPEEFEKWAGITPPK